MKQRENRNDKNQIRRKNQQTQLESAYLNQIEVLSPFPLEKYEYKSNVNFTIRKKKGQF